VPPEFDFFTEDQLAHGRFGALAKRLAFFWCVNKSQTDPDLLLGKDQHVDRIAIDNTCYAPVDSDVLQAKSVRGAF
jgi:hypothetical protein